MKVSFPVKFRLLGPRQKVGKTDTENLSLFIRKGKKKGETGLQASQRRGDPVAGP